MPLTYATPPATGWDILAESLRALLSSPGGAGVMRGLDTQDLLLVDPHPAFVVAADDLAKREFLRAARPATWRYLIVKDTVAVAEAELSYDAANPTFVAIHEGPFADASLRAIRAALGLPRVRHADFEVRYIKAPAVYFAALWLHGHDSDLLIPLGDQRKGLKQQVYTDEQIISVLTPVAKQAIQFERRERRRGSQ